MASSPIPMRKIGLYGGSFDPVHRSHVEIVRSALGYGLEKIIVIPCRISPYKQGNPPVAPEHRWAMLEAAFRSSPRVELCRYELEGRSISYTHRTIAHIQHLYPDARLSLILGYDQLASLSLWKNFSEWEQKTDYLVFPRDGLAVEIPPQLQHLKITAAKEDVPPISSTRIRLSVQLNKSLRTLVPRAVEEYIRKNRLYL